MTVRVLVRSKRDVDAVKASLKRFPETSHWIVESLGGVRGEHLYNIILDKMKPFTIILLGREDSHIYKEIEKITYKIPFTAVVLARTKRIRNSTMEMINSLLSRARAIFRMRTLWKDSYILSGWKDGEPMELPIEPYGDIFFLYGRGASHALDILGITVNNEANRETILLAVKLARGLHYIYSGSTPIGEINMTNYGLLPKGKHYDDINIVKINKNNIIDKNKQIIEILVKESTSYLEKIASYDRIIVPVSGGKDSAAALLLALEKFERDMISIIYIDTGIDFEENKEYVGRLADKFGVELIIEKADVDKGLLQGLPLPSFEHRWCTGRKLAALRKAIENYARETSRRIALIVGDRDSESDKRGRKPLLRVDPNLPYPTIAPLKLWSAAHVTLFLWSKGIELNPLYELGFYRTGCYLCYSLRSWELSIMLRNQIFDKILKTRPHHKVFIEQFLEEKSRVR